MAKGWSRRAVVGGVGALAAATAVRARADVPDVLTIGAILSMSGSSPYYGTVMSRGAGMAIDEINAKGGVVGKKLRLVIEDHRSGNTQAAVDGMTRLITLENAQAVLLSFSGPTVAIAPLSEQKQVFVINGGGVSPKMIGVSRYMFHNRALAADLATGVIQRAHERGLDKVAQIAIKSEFGDSAIAATAAVSKQLGMTVAAVEQFDQAATNIDTQVAKLRAAQPDVIADWPTTPQSGMVVKRVREFGMRQPVLAMEWTAEDTKLAGVQNAEGVEVVTDYFGKSADNPLGNHFYDAYKAKYGEAPDFYAANYYEAVFVIAECIRRAEAKGGDWWSGARLADALRQDASFDSVYGGKMTFDKDGVAHKRLALLRIHDGEPVLERYMQVGSAG